MALGEPLFAQQARAVRRQAQQPQLVGDGGLRFPQLLRRLLLREAVGSDELRDGRGLLQIVQVAALEIFDQREQRALLLARSRQQARHLAQSRQHCRAQATLPRDELVALLRAADGQRLQNSVAPDAFAQLVQRALVEVAARLVGIGMQRVRGQVHHAR